MYDARGPCLIIPQWIYSLDLFSRYYKEKIKPERKEVAQAVGAFGAFIHVAISIVSLLMWMLIHLKTKLV